MRTIWTIGATLWMRIRTVVRKGSIWPRPVARCRGVVICRVGSDRIASTIPDGDSVRLAVVSDRREAARVYPAYRVTANICVYSWP